MSQRLTEVDMVRQTRTQPLHPHTVQQRLPRPHRLVTAQATDMLLIKSHHHHHDNALEHETIVPYYPYRRHKSRGSGKESSFKANFTFVVWIGHSNFVNSWSFSWNFDGWYHLVRRISCTVTELRSNGDIVDAFCEDKEEDIWIFYWEKGHCLCSL